MAERINRPLKESGATVRLVNCLLNTGCRTLSDAARLTEYELLRIPNFGKKSLNELKHLLAGGEPLTGPHMLIPFHRVAVERKLAALQQRKRGKTFRQIGQHFGVSVERARQLVAAGQRLEETIAT